MKSEHSAEDLNWARDTLASRPRLNVLIAEMRAGVPGAFDEVAFLNECFQNGMPCADLDGRMGRLVDEGERQ